MSGLAKIQLAPDARRELLENILPFWRGRAMDQEHGGFIAEMSNDLRLRTDAAKGLILNGRILWTFSAVCRLTHQVEDQSLAQRAYEYLTRCFLDPQHGGYFWELTPQGQVADDKKKSYGQAFGIYALAEYYRAFREPQALEQAIELFRLLESQARDSQHGGYFEVLSRDWQPVADMRLSDKDLNAQKSMNNHLHVLEAYTNLWRVWPDPLLADRLRELIDLFRQRILNPEQTHFRHFFDAAWNPLSDNYTFGHDIEGSWLLAEAAEVLGDEHLLAAVQSVAIKMARAVRQEGLDATGGLCYEGLHGQVIDSGKEWWPQAEAVVGFYNAWQLSQDPGFRDAAVKCWQFIQNRLVDRVHGEWFWRVAPDGKVDANLPKVSAWKCPYHNSRCCLEIIRRAAADENPQSATRTNTTHL